MLYIFGGGHVSCAVARTASAVGFAVGVADDRETFANAERFPMAGEIYTTYEDAFEKIKPNASSYLLIVTRGHKDDMRVLAWAVRTDARYIGMIGSKRKVLSVYKALEKESYSPEEFERVHAPVGLDIGALTPEEIAVSIAAELIAVRRNAQTCRTSPSSSRKRLERHTIESDARRAPARSRSRPPRPKAARRGYSCRGRIPPHGHPEGADPLPRNDFRRTSTRSGHAPAHGHHARGARRARGQNPRAKLQWMPRRSS